jgi:hypothetical protein
MTRQVGFGIGDEEAELQFTAIDRRTPEFGRGGSAADSSPRFEP